LRNSNRKNYIYNSSKCNITSKFSICKCNNMDTRINSCNNNKRNKDNFKCLNIKWWTINGKCRINNFNNNKCRYKTKFLNNNNPISCDLIFYSLILLGILLFLCLFLLLFFNSFLLYFIIRLLLLLFSIFFFVLNFCNFFIFLKISIHQKNCTN